MGESDTPGQRHGLSDRLVAFLVAEGVAVLIALVTPVTPSKTGSTWTPADLIIEDPSYLEEVLASFVLVNLMLAVLGLLVWIVSRRDRA